MIIGMLLVLMHLVLFVGWYHLGKATHGQVVLMSIENGSIFTASLYEDLLVQFVCYVFVPVALPVVAITTLIQK